ncbi:aldo/keto reductase [Acholeplasma hippikon]|uniref:Glyoxal reductase n=1 Tax=Acholeplasma hippikon TaxID=264636 RepID=A0A449BK36_9MOLU|nr:aldo/keto reductase [Acholeplasma hippikon]VEU82687.1 Glyoxal reductase [Acholeplasma hippikon]
MFKSKFLKGVDLSYKHAVYTLSNGVKIPVVGFGTWQVKDGNEAYLSVMEALKVGYRHIDTAEAYRNEESVGRAIKDSGIPREELFITTKLWNQHGTYEEAKEALENSLKRLGLNYVDLYIIHWPHPLAHRGNSTKRNSEVYRAMEDAYLEGKIRSIGVSNFKVHHLEDLLKTARIKPMVNQIFVNPSDQQKDVVEFNEKHDILTEAYSPLGTGKIFGVTQLEEIANKYNKTIGQVVLRWSLDHGYLPLPKSVTPSRIKENLGLFDFKLDALDIEIIDNLYGAFGLALDPDTADF